MNDPNSRLLSLCAILFMLLLIFTSNGSRFFSRLLGNHFAGFVVSENITIPTVVKIEPKVTFPQITAHAYMVRFVGDKNPLAIQRAEKMLPLASLTKIFTATLAYELLGQTTHINFSHDAKIVGEKVSTAHEGETFSRDDVIRLALINSANDAATALAEAVGKSQGAFGFEGSLKTFQELLNKKVQELGLLHTAFKNPSGLDEDGHYSSVEDLANFVEYVEVNHPQIWKITQTIEGAVVSDLGQSHPLLSTNILLKEFPALVGGKTGYTDKAGESLILLYATKSGKTVIIVLLRSQDRFEDGRKVLRWLDEAF